MATLKPYQVAAAALLGGFPPGEVPTAVAVAKGESSYNTTDSNSCCTGLWQVHRTAHADKIAAHGGLSKLTDPVVNATIAREIWAGNWCGGRAPNGHCAKYEAYGLSNAGMSWQAKLAEGARAYAEVQQRQGRGETLQSMVGSGVQNADFLGIPTPGDTLGGIVDAAGAIASTGQAMIDFGNKLGRWIADPQSWIRVAEVIGGGVLVGIGLRIAFNKQYMAIGKQIVGMVVPAGKAAKIAGTVSSAAKGAT